MKKHNSTELIPLNEDGTKVKIMYYHLDGSKKELLNETEEQCSLPQFICKFDGFGTIEIPQISLGDGDDKYQQTKKLEFGKKLFATFFTSEDHFSRNMSPYDYEIVTPTKPIKENDYVGLYNDIYSRMKLWNGDTAKDIPEEHRPHFLKQIERFQNDKSKQDFLCGYVMTMLKFELIRPKVKSFIDEYLQQNPQYKYVRIFND
jgi:hypothetical protein